MKSFVLLLLALATPVLADTMRCGNRLVYEGDEAAKVEARCGKPTQISRSTIFKYPSVWHHGRLYRLGDQEVAVPVETWLYNLGSNKLMRKLRFEDGILMEIETLEYGY